MNFALTEDQCMIRDAAESFLLDASGSANVRAAMQSAAGYDEAVWRQIGGELGWCAMPIAEAHGGLGLGAVETVLMLEQMGRRLLCSPYFSTVCLAANLLQQSGSNSARSRLLPLIARGQLRISTPLPSALDWSTAAADLRARREGQHWRLDGVSRRLPDGAIADHLLVFARVDDGIGLFELAAGTTGLTLKALDGWDATRRFADAEFNSVRLDAVARCDDPARAAEGPIRAAALARLYLAAEQLGGAQQCLDMTVAYTATRKQFGRTIASFQAVKHRCADMMVRCEALRSAVYGSAALAAGPVTAELLELETAATRALAADSYFHCAQEAIQLHGGVGFTWEYDPHLHLKRAQAGSHWLGSADDLRERIAQSVIAQ